MDKQEMLSRTKRYAIRIIKLVAALPKNMVAQELGRQLLRSGTSVGANYRAAHRARSTAEFIAKMGIVEEEADESGYWLELITETGCIKPSRLRDLMQETEELLKIVVATIRSKKRGKN